MTHLEMIVTWFQSRGGSATLRDILTSGEVWSHEFNARKTDLRHRTQYDLVLERGKKASDNLYRLVDRHLAPVKFGVEPSGQMVMI